jgi:hypothetical protein
MQFLLMYKSNTQEPGQRKKKKKKKNRINWILIRV